MAPVCHGNQALEGYLAISGKEYDKILFCMNPVKLSRRFFRLMEEHFISKKSDTCFIVQKNSVYMYVSLFTIILAYMFLCPEKSRFGLTNSWHCTACFKGNSVAHRNHAFYLESFGIKESAI